MKLTRGRHRIIAACVPALKQLFEKVLGRLGILTSQAPNRRSGYMYREQASWGDHKLRTLGTATTISSYSRQTPTQVTFLQEASQESILPAIR